jgi:hypothetical protein
MDVVWTGNHIFRWIPVPMDVTGWTGFLSFPSIWFLFPWMVDGQETLSHFGSMVPFFG